MSQRPVFIAQDGTLWCVPALSFLAGAVNAAEPLYRWRWRKVLGERHGQLFCVVARGALNSCMVEFLCDGARVITSRNALRRARPQ